MDEDPIAYLRKNYSELGLRLLRHCICKAKLSYGWSDTQTMPGGRIPEQVVEEVMEKYLVGDRKLAPEHAVLTQLKRGINSWLYAIYTSKDGRSQSLDHLAESSSFYIIDDSASPDISAGNKCDEKALYQMLCEHPKIQANTDLGLIVLSVQEGAETAAEQATATSLAIDKVYVLRRELKPIILEVLNKLNKGALLPV